MEILTIEHFKPHVGKTVRFKGTPHAFVLDRIEGDSSPPPPGYARAPFLLIFRGASKSDVMGVGMYECEFDSGPTYSLHVMPVHTPRPDCQEYQSAFN
jgi:hypothetical protein